MAANGARPPVTRAQESLLGRDAFLVDEADCDLEPRDYRLDLMKGGMSEFEAALCAKAIRETLQEGRDDPDCADYAFVLARKILRHVPLSDRKVPTIASRYFLAFVLLSKEMTPAEKAQQRKVIKWDDEEELDGLWYNVWRKVRAAEGEDALTIACTRADCEMLPFEHAAGKYLRFLNIAYRLQEAAGTKPIMLPVSDRLADHLGCTKVFVGTCVDRAVDSGMLLPVDRRYNLVAKKARTFRFIGQPAEPAP